MVRTTEHSRHRIRSISGGNTSSGFLRQNLVRARTNTHLLIEHRRAEARRGVGAVRRRVRDEHQRLNEVRQRLRLEVARELEDLLHLEGGDAVERSTAP